MPGLVAREFDFHSMVFDLNWRAIVLEVVEKVDFAIHQCNHKGAWKTPRA